MAGGSRTLKIEILGNDRTGSKALASVEKSAGSLAGTIVKTAAGLAAGVGGFLALKGAILGSIDAASESQKIQAQTEAVLKSTGGAAGVTAKQVGDLATKLSQITPVDDEVIQSAENLLLTFTNIGQDVFPDATKTVLDMSVALGQDTKTSAIQLGKALNDPVKGVTALQKVGVSFTKQQKDQIKTLVESGKTMEAQKVILAELNKEFGGSAEAAGKTFAGQLAILKTQLGNIQEQISGALLPVLTRLIGVFATNLPAGIAVVTTVLGRLRDLMSGPVNYAFTLARDAILTFIAALHGDWTNVDGIRPLHQLFGDLGLSIRAIYETFELIKRGKFEAALTKVFDALKLDAQTLANLGKDLGSAILDGLTGIGKKVADRFEHELSGISWSDVSRVVTSGISQGIAAGGRLVGLGADIGSQIFNWINGEIRGVDWSGAAGSIRAGLGTALSGIGALALGAVGVGTQIFNWISGEISGIDWSGVAGTIRGGIASGFGAAVGAVGSAAGAVVSAGQAIYTWISGEISNTDWSGLAGSIRNGIANGFAVFVQGAKGAISAGQQLLNWIANEITSVDWAAVADDIRSGIANAFTSVQQVAKGAVSIGARIRDWVYDEIQNTDWSNVGAEIRAKIEDALNLQPAGGGGGGAGTAGGLLKGIFDNISKGAADLAVTIKTNLIGSFQLLTQQAEPATKILKDFGVAVGAGFLAIGTLASKIFSLGVVSAPVNVLFAGFNVIIATFGQVLDDIATPIQAAIDLFSNWRHPIDGVRQAISDLSDFADRSAERWNSVFSIMGQTLEDFGTRVGTTISAAVTTISGFPGQVQSIFSGAGSWLSQAGHDIVQGLIDGIGSMFQAVKDKLGALTDLIPSWKGPMSKDLKLLEPTGKAIIQGLANGMLTYDAVISAADSVSDALVNAMITGITKGVSSDVMVPRLTANLLPSLLKAQDAAQSALDLAQLSGASDEELAGLQAKVDAATSLVTRWYEFNQTTFSQWFDDAKAAAEAPVTAITDDALSQIVALAKDMKDKGAGLLDAVVAGLEAGKLKLKDAVKILPDTVLPAIQGLIDKLKSDLAEALLKGTDPGPIRANIDLLTQLFKDLGGSIALAVQQMAGMTIQWQTFDNAVANSSDATQAIVTGSSGGTRTGGSSGSSGGLHGTATAGDAGNIDSKVRAGVYTIGADGTVYDENGNDTGYQSTIAGGGGYRTKPGSQARTDQMASRGSSGVNVHNTFIVDGAVFHDAVKQVDDRHYTARISPFGSTP